jgi:hypothetical protein
VFFAVNVNVQVGTTPATIVSVQVVVTGFVVKMTLPLGMAAPAKVGVTVAVAVTAALTAAGLGKDVTAVTGVPLLTVCTTVFEGPLVKFEFALVNVATIEWETTGAEVEVAEENATVQEGTFPPVKVIGVPAEPNVQPGSATPLSA